MPTKRKKLTRKPESRITNRAVELYRRAKADPDNRDLSLALRHELGLKLWEIGPVHAVGECPYPPGKAGNISWPRAVDLRNALEAEL
jgi:hypothetical protein